MAMTNKILQESLVEIKIILMNNNFEISTHLEGEMSIGTDE